MLQLHLLVLQIVWSIFLSLTTHGDDDSACYAVPGSVSEAVAYSSCWLQWSKVNVEYWSVH